jgi:hypothetical protein
MLSSNDLVAGKHDGIGGVALGKRTASGARSPDDVWLSNLMLRKPFVCNEKFAVDNELGKR